MFYDPEPHQDQYLDSSDMDNPKHNMDAFNKDYDSWKERQIKPEEPKGELRGNYKHNNMLAWELRRKSWPLHYNVWSEYFEKLAYYEGNRLRWKAFKKSIRQDHLCYYLDTTQFTFEVNFHYNSERVDVHFTDDEDNEILCLYYMDGLLLETFNSNLKNCELELTH